MKKNHQDIDSKEALRQKLESSEKAEYYVPQAEAEWNDPQRPEENRISVAGGVVLAVNLRQQFRYHNAPSKIASPAIVIASDASDQGK